MKICMHRIQEDAHEESWMMMDAGNDVSNFDQPPPSPTEYFEDELMTEEKKPNIFNEDPFEKRLVVKAERLKECLVSDEYFLVPDTNEKYRTSKIHGVPTRADKREAIFIAKNEKIENNENMLEFPKEEINKFVSCSFCNEKVASLKKYKQLECLLCDEEFPDVQKLVDHYTTINSENIIFRSCDICGEEIKDVELLWTHLLSHNEEKYECGNCTNEFKFINDLKIHFYEAREMPFSCANCPQKFSTVLRLQLHEKEDHFKSEEKRQKIHQNEEKTNQLICCPFCNDRFITFVEYKRHILQHKKRKNCLLCSDKFHNVRKLVDHYILKHDGEKIVKCKICDKGFLAYQRRNLIEHMTLTHGKKHKKRINRFHSCDMCGEKINGEKLFRAHLLSHNDTKHKCVYCWEEFNEIELERHYQEAHSGEIPFSCADCQQTFLTEERFQLHEKEFHPKERSPIQKKLICEECGKGFKQKHNFKTHMACHLPVEDRRKLFCRFCDKSFLKHHSLVIHMREHTGEKPYPCTLCDKAFISPAILKLHNNSVHNRKGHTCEFCKNSYNSRKYLVKHVKLYHSRESSRESLRESFACDLCPEKFSKPEFLKRHIKTLHNHSRRFACDQCSWRFNFRSNLSLHKKGVHEKMGPVYPKKKKVSSIK